MSERCSTFAQRTSLPSAGVLCGVLACAWPAPAAAQALLDILKNSVVLVHATQGDKTYAASGFVWQGAPPGSSFVVTALHAATGAVTVQCAGTVKRASVERVLPDADLVLLKTESSFQAPCAPLPVRIQANKPATDTPLKVLGFLAGSRSLTDRDSVKGLADPETLDWLLREPVLSEQRRFGIPSVRLDIYYVKGGLLPGYSGGPVFNARTGELVGIVDGGLDKGTDGYNWVIPASNLNALLRSPLRQIPLNVALGGPAHFASPIVDVPILSLPPTAGRGSGTAPGRGGIVRPDVAALVRSRTALLQFSQNGWNYRYVRTKTRSLAELARTADDPAGVMHLLQVYAPVVGPNAASRMMFDIYEEVDRGLIIAVPSGQPLRFDSSSQFRSLRSETPNSNLGYSEFEEPRMTDDVGRPLDAEYQILQASDGSGSVKASGPGFLRETVSELVAIGNRPGQWTTTLDAASLRMIDFGNGSKVLKLGLRKRQVSPAFDLYEYHAYAVRGPRVFHATTYIYGASDGLMECAARPTAACANSTTAFQQLSQLVATHLTTFAGLAGQTNLAPREDRFVYDNRSDDPRTLRRQYYQGNVIRFYNSRGKVWLESGTYAYDQVLVAKTTDANFVYLQNGDQWYKVPINGGQYGISTDGGQTYRNAGILQRR